VVAEATKLDKEDAELLLDFMRRDARFFLLQMKTRRNADDVYLGRSDLYLDTLRILAERGLIGPDDLSSMLHADDPLLPQALLLSAERGDVPKEDLLGGYMALRTWVASFAMDSKALETIAQRSFEGIRSQGVDERKLKTLEAFAEM
jgi:hypothetical protein